MFNDDDAERSTSVFFTAEQAREPGGAERIVAALREASRIQDEQKLRDEVDSAPWQDAVTSSAYDLAWTRAELNRFLHYFHPIPMREGMSATYVGEHYPDWTWDELLDIVEDAKVIARGIPPRCHPDLGVFHFNRDGSWLIEWENSLPNTTSSQPRDPARRSRSGVIRIRRA